MSMVAHSQTIFSNNVTLEKVAKHWVRKTGYMLNKGIAFRKANPDQKFTDVFYEELISDPIRILEEIYRESGAISPDLHQRFLETERQNTQNKYGNHVYNLEDFELTLSDVNKKVSTYIEFLKTLKK
jgi:hypothetical protein